MRVELGARGGGLDVVVWRREQLVQSGFPGPFAVRIAGNGRFDLHALIELVERGCPAELAVRIVAPLDADGGVD